MPFLPKQFYGFAAATTAAFSLAGTAAANTGAYSNPDNFVSSQSLQIPEPGDMLAFPSADGKSAQEFMMPPFCRHTFPEGLVDHKSIASAKRAKHGVVVTPASNIDGVLICQINNKISANIDIVLGYDNLPVKERPYYYYAVGTTSAKLSAAQGAQIINERNGIIKPGILFVGKAAAVVGTKSAFHTPNKDSAEDINNYFEKQNHNLQIAKAMAVEQEEELAKAEEAKNITLAAEKDSATETSPAQPAPTRSIQIASAAPAASASTAPPPVVRVVANAAPVLQLASIEPVQLPPALGLEQLQPMPEVALYTYKQPPIEDTPVTLVADTTLPRKTPPAASAQQQLASKDQSDDNDSGAHRDNAVYYHTNTNGPTNGGTPGGDGSGGGVGPGATPTTLASIAHDGSALFTDPLIRKISDGHTAAYKATFVSAANDHMPNNNIGLGALAAIGMMGITSFGFGRHKQIRRALGRPTPRPLTGLERAYGEGYGKVTGLEGVYGEGYGKDFLYDSSWTKNRLQRNTAKFPGQNITVAIGKHLQNNWGSILASGIAGSFTSIGMKAIGIKAAFALAAVCVGAPAGVIVIPVVLATGVAAGFSASVVSKFVFNGVKELQKAPGQKSWKNWLTVSSAQAFNWKSFGLSAGFGILGASIGLAAHYQQVIEGIKHAQHVTDLAKNATANANLHAGHVNATVHADPAPAMPDVPTPPAPQPTDLQGMLQSSDLGAENAGLVRKALAAMSHHHNVSAMARVRDIVGQLAKSNVHEAANLNQAALDYGANHHIDSGRVFNVLRGNQSYLNAKLAM